MRQIKEKAPATPASVTSANHNNQVKDTTKKLIRQAECASEVSQTYPAKAPYQISEYMEYCDCVGKQPNQFVIEQLDIYLKSPRSKPRNREENEAEAIQKIKLLSPFERAAIVEIMEFFVWKNQRKKSHIA